MPLSIITLLVLSLFCYVASVAWLLYAEARRELVGVVILTIVAAALRVLWVYDLPPGLNDDEIQNMLKAFVSANIPGLFSPGVEGPLLHPVLFQLPVTMLTQSLFWGSRTYPLILGILSVPLAFVIGKSYQLSVRSSFVLAALVAVLPWSLFWSRLPWGGEILFYQGLLVAALARIIWRDGGMRDVLVGVVGLTGLLWEYTGAWCMVCMPVVGVVLARGIRRKMYAATVFAGGLLLWSPYLLRSSRWMHYVTEKVASPGSGSSWSDISYLPQVLSCFRVFREPVGGTSWLSMHSVAIHPQIVLLMALLGLASLAPRKTLFNLCGFAAGIFTASVSSAGTPSTHRMMCSYLFIAISSAGAFHALEKFLKGPRAGFLSTMLALLFTVSAGVTSWRIFLSDEFWKNGEGSIFLHGETLLAEALRPSASAPAIVDGEMARALLARNEDPRAYKTLSYANWLPIAAGEQAFNRRFEALIPLYKEVVAPERVRVFGGVSYPKSFSVRFDEAEAKTVSSLGWSLTIDCKDGTPVKSFRVPTLMMDTLLNGFSSYCPAIHEYRYVATWVGAPTELLLVHGPVQNLEVISPSTVIDSKRPTFAVKTGQRVEIKVTTFDSTGSVKLYLASDSDARMPPLRSFVP